MWKKGFNLFTQVLVIAAATSILIVNTGWWRGDPPTVPGRYVIGDTIQATEDLSFGVRTVVLNTASSCRFCTDSMAFYQRLQASGARIIAVTPEPIETNAAYLDSHGIKPERVISAAANGLHFGGTPSLVVV